MTEPTTSAERGESTPEYIEPPRARRRMDLDDALVLLQAADTRNAHPEVLDALAVLVPNLLRLRAVETALVTECDVMREVGGTVLRVDRVTSIIASGGQR